MSKFVLPVEFATPAYDETVDLRNQILRVPLGLEFTVEQLAEECDQFHLACYDEGWGIVGCLVLNPLDKDTVKMRQVAVWEANQGQGIGKIMVVESETFSKEKGYINMVLNARDTAVPFYEKLGYKKVGKKFIEVGIDHFKMQKKL